MKPESTLNENSQLMYFDYTVLYHVYLRYFENCKFIIKAFFLFFEKVTFSVISHCNDVMKTKVHYENF